MSLSKPINDSFLVGHIGTVLAKTVDTYETSQLILYSCAIFIGIIIWISPWHPLQVYLEDI